MINSFIHGLLLSVLVAKFGDSSSPSHPLSPYFVIPFSFSPTYPSPLISSCSSLFQSFSTDIASSASRMQSSRASISRVLESPISYQILCGKKHPLQQQRISKRKRSRKVCAKYLKLAKQQKQVKAVPSRKDASMKASNSTTETGKRNVNINQHNQSSSSFAQAKSHNYRRKEPLSHVRGSSPSLIIKQGSRSERRRVRSALDEDQRSDVQKTCTPKVAMVTHGKLPAEDPKSTSFTHWNRTRVRQPATLHRPLVPSRALTTASLSRGWSQGQGSPLQVGDIAVGLGRLNYHNVIVMSGAGISTPSGIPDFRTPGTGLYDNLQKYNLPEPSAVFDIGFFARNPRPFFSLAKELYPGRYAPNLVHGFVRLLQDKGILLRNYTQNIDGLERLAGVKGSKLVEAHGSFSTASCTQCGSKQDPMEIKKAIFSDRIPRCSHKQCNGVVKPDIVFFGEDLSRKFYSHQHSDFSKCDLLIIMGTSLQIEPFASLATLPRPTVPRVLLNREMVGPFRFHQGRNTDVAVIGDLVRSVQVLVKGAGWKGELEEVMQKVKGQRHKKLNEADVETVTTALSELHIYSPPHTPSSHQHTHTDDDDIDSASQFSESRSDLPSSPSAAD